MTSLDLTFHICEVEAMAVAVGPSVCINLRDGEWPVRRLADNSHVENGSNRTVTIIEGCRGGMRAILPGELDLGGGKRSSHSQNSGRGRHCRLNQERDGQRPRKNETEP